MDRNDGTDALVANSSSLASAFACPVCADYVLPPIVQCPNGHIVCSSCRARLTSCPTCRGPLGDIRNLAMEEVASNVAFPCKYALDGCTSTLSCKDKPAHEGSCEFRPCTCPCPGVACAWQGPIGGVMEHVTQSHPTIPTLQGEDVVFEATDLFVPGLVDTAMVQSCFGHHFLVVLEKQEEYDGRPMLYAAVQVIGSQRQAEQFAYRLEINGPRRRLTWEATPRSMHDGAARAIAENDCLFLGTLTVPRFVEDGCVTINATIYRV